MNDQISPDPEVRPRVERRKFTAEYKRDILSRADQCSPAEPGALLRTEGLYSSHVSKWRKKERNSSRLDGLPSKSKPPPKDPRPPNA